MDIMVVFEQMLVLLILLIVGVIAAKCGVMDADTTRRFTRFTLLIPQTCMILGSVINADLGITPGRVFAILCLAVGHHGHAGLHIGIFGIASAENEAL